jgi:hypothetical protein
MYAMMSQRMPQLNYFSPPFFRFPLKSRQTLTANPLRNPPVSRMGSMQLMNVEAKTQMKDMTIQAVKKAREKT